MRAVDAWAIEEQGVPSLDLMERAGTGLARCVARVAAPGPVRVVIGKGNNGGDGLVVARLLARRRTRGGRAVDRRRWTSCGATLLPISTILPGDPPEPFDAAALDGSGVVLDALLGTGFSGEPREPVAGAIAAINAADAPVVACDVPSGVDASTGEVAGQAVRADLTCTFHGSKVGLHVAPGAHHAGEVEPIEIGIPRGAPAPRARRADLRPGARPLPASHPRRLEVHVRRGRGGRRRRRAHRRAHDGRPGGAARGGGLRPGSGAQVG